MSDARAPHWSAQDGFDVRFDWGVGGVDRLAPGVATIVIVDVFRFTTAVEAAVAAGVAVMPYRWKDESAGSAAREAGALLAGRDGAPSLSPSSFGDLPAGTRVVLPSRNGAACTMRAAEHGRAVVASCLRNASAVASFLRATEGPVGVIASGETWTDGTLRPSFEDLLGAAATIARLDGTMSPEAMAARVTLVPDRARLEEWLHACASGRELLEARRSTDVSWCCDLDVSDVVPVLRDGWFGRA